MSGNSAGFCDTRLLLGHLREIRSLSTLFFRPKRLLMFVKIHLFANSREHQHFVPIEFVGGGVARTIKIIFLILIEFLMREIRSLSTLFFRPKRLLMFVKIHLFANSREHQHFVPIEFVGGGVARTIKIIFLILIEFLIPFARLGFNYLFFLRFDIGLKGCVLIEKFVQFIVKYRSLN